MKSALPSILLATVYLTIYILIAMCRQHSLAHLLFVFSPVVVAFMVFKVLKSGTYPKGLCWEDGIPEKMYEDY